MCRTIAAAGLLMLLFVSAARAASLTIPLTSPADSSAPISKSLLLRVHGTPGHFQVEVRSAHRVRGCHENLIYRAPHGPDPSTVMPWNVTKSYFPNVRIVPVCGEALDVVITIRDARVEGADAAARFVSGTLRASVLPRNATPAKVKRAGKP